MLDPMGHERVREYGGSRESKQETIWEHQEKIIIAETCSNTAVPEKKGE